MYKEDDILALLVERSIHGFCYETFQIDIRLQGQNPRAQGKKRLLSETAFLLLISNFLQYNYAGPLKKITGGIFRTSKRVVRKSAQSLK